VVYVNTVGVEAAQRRTGPVPSLIEWREAPRELPAPLQAYLDEGMSEGVAWKFLPIRAFPDGYELALDNDVILWREPEPIAQWRTSQRCLIAEDVAPGHGAFASLCGSQPRNSGIRGTPPRFDLGAQLARVLQQIPTRLRSELDEQGMQVAAVSLDAPPFVVSTTDVTICSPFHPHQPHLGTCGAHFVGLNARELPWTYYDRPATEVRIEHWNAHVPELRRRVGLDGSSCFTNTHSSSETTSRRPAGV
jgi:hypothetical protein